MPDQLKITGQVTIVPCTEMDRDGRIFVIMGPTGAGKSTFIEALAGAGQSLRISKDQLEGFTQEVMSYRLENAAAEWIGGDGETLPIYVIDTPGFSDSKISEMEIINKLKGWTRDNHLLGINQILYLTPITDTRVPGSKRRTIKMLQSLLRVNSASSVTIVTTMWNTVFSTQATERAEAHFEQLGSDIWKDLVEKGAEVAQFKNDQASAISILRDALEKRTVYALGQNPMSRSDKSVPLLYQYLLDRISNSRRAIESLRVDHHELIAHPDPLLESWVRPQLQEARQTLAKFLGQLVQFGEPPLGFEGVPQQVVYQDLLDHVNEVKEDIQALDLALNMDPVMERELALRAQLAVAEENLAEHSEKLILHRDAPPGFEQALVDALVPPKRLLIPALSVSASDTMIPLTPSPPPHTVPPPMAPNIVVVHSRITPGATPEGSVASRASFGDRFKKGVKSVRDKIVSPFKRQPRH